MKTPHFEKTTADDGLRLCMPRTFYRCLSSEIGAMMGVFVGWAKARSAVPTVIEKVSKGA